MQEGFRSSNGYVRTLMQKSFNRVIRYMWTIRAVRVFRFESRRYYLGRDGLHYGCFDLMNCPEESLLEYYKRGFGMKARRERGHRF